MWIRLGLVACFMAFAMGGWADSPIPEKRIALTRNVDLPGGDIQSIFDTTLDACQRACLANDTCGAFTFNTNALACFLKDQPGEAEFYDGAFSGAALQTPANVVGQGEARAAELDFLHERDIEGATEVALTLTNSHVPNDWTLEQLLSSAAEARANGNIAAAYRFTGAATVLSDAADGWVEYARLALAIQTDQAAERGTYQQRALSAAINGYLRAEGAATQANALVVMAQALETRGRGTEVIPALRRAIALDPRQDIEDALEDAIAKYGFRIADHQVDSDLGRPRVCATFSEDLAKAGVDYAPFVQVPRADLTVEPDGRQLCIEGVEHGARYEVTFREGLPAASGERMAKSVTLNLYVRDRAPLVRFPGRAYVLPAAGEIALPVETVNTSALDLILRRVSDRNVLRAIQDNYFGRSLRPWEEALLDGNIATEVWRGTGEVGQELNRDVTTRLPLNEVMGSLEPGVYALQASIAGEARSDTPAATQWFVVSDLGLASMMGDDGLHVFLRALGTAEVLEGIEVSLLSRSNEVLATLATDAMGYARFDPGLVRGQGGAEPALLLAKTETDLSFLSLTDAEFDLSDRGVEGRAPARPIDTFIATDRGAYRAGEPIHATVLTRDAKGAAIEGLPLTAIFTRPDGVEFSRSLSQSEVAGGHVFTFGTTGAAPRGAWRIDIHSDVDAPALASTRVLVEDFLPERIDFEMALPEGPISVTDRPRVTLDARYLFGAPAGDLPIEGEVLLRSASTMPDYPGYVFGRHDSAVQPEVWFLPGDLRTDSDGRASVSVEFPELEPSFGPLEAVVALRISEGSGRPVERKITKRVLAGQPMIGIKPGFDGPLGENAEARFDLIALDAAGQPSAMEVRWRVERVETQYQWYQYNGNWEWEPITTRSKIAEGEATLGQDPVGIDAQLEWGRYEIRVERVDGPYVASSQSFDAGWYGGADTTATPDLLEVSLDAESYRPGDTAQLRIVPRYAGKALVTVMSNRLIDMKAIELGAGETLVDLPVTDAWGAGAYVTATLVRPMQVEQGRNPARALGLQYAAVDPGPRQLAARFDTPAEVDPRGPLPVALKVEGVAEGETAFVTIAAVDVGILNITGFETPDPSGYYFGQRKLGIGMRDVYGRLIDGLNGSLGRLRSGGDATAAINSSAPPPIEELVAYFTGPLEVGADGYARTEFDLPSFNGTVKLMGVAWTKTGMGAADAEVLVRDPVVVTASVPRFMAPGDQSRLLLELTHASGPVGRMGLDVEASGLRIDSNVPSGVTLSENGREVLSLPISADAPGLHRIDITLSTPAGKVLRKTLTVPVQVNDPVTARMSRFSLAAGDRFTFSSDVFAGLRAGTGSATLAAGPIARLDVPGLLQALDRYPYGCTEQVTSRALPLLYMDEVADALGLGGRKQLDTRIDGAIAQVLTNQASNGSFGLWRAGSGDFWLDAYVTDFLSRARAQGRAVPDLAFRLALDNLRNRVNSAPDFDEGGEALAYALYVLAREGAASLGDLRYYADVKADALATPLAAAQLGAALAAYGDPTRADRMFGIAARMIAQDISRSEPALWRSDYGTRLRDRAAVLTLAAEAGSAAVDQELLMQSISPAEGTQRRSTQEQVWSLLAANAVLGSSAARLSVDGQPADGPVIRLLEDQAAFAPLTITNTGEAEASITLTTFGVPEVPEAAGGTGYAIDRRYFTMEGTPVELDQVAQGTRLVVVLTVTPFEESAARLMVNDPLPAGFEIDNPNLMRAGDVRALDWLDLNSTVESTQFRQERFLAAVDWRSDQPFRLGYVVRAVSPGEFHHPAASVEDMYRPEYRATSEAGRVTITE